jgi:hypothetical protein
MIDSDDFAHQILLECPDRKLVEAADWCAEQFPDDAWFVYSFSDSKTSLFGFKNEDHIFEFKMRWV